MAVVPALTVIVDMAFLVGRKHQRGFRLNLHLETRATDVPVIAFKILDLQDASAVAAISPSHMRQLIKRGEGPALTRIGRRVGVRTDKLAEWLESRTSPVTHQAA